MQICYFIPTLGKHSIGQLENIVNNANRLENFLMKIAISGNLLLLSLLCTVYVHDERRWKYSTIKHLNIATSYGTTRQVLCNAVATAIIQ